MSDSCPALVLTGATGNIGSKLRRHWQNQYEIRPIDFNSKGDESVLCADLATRNDRWESRLRGADFLVHLAANPDALQSWESAQRNIKIDYFVFQAARKARVRRILYGSSNHVMGGYKDVSEPWGLSTDLPPLPGTSWDLHGKRVCSRNYALAKLFGEEIGQCCASTSRTAVIAVRIGWVQLGRNLPEDMAADTPEWVRLLWLSNEDLCRLFSSCLTATVPDASFLILNGMSANRDMRWDLESARALVGYNPGGGLQTK